MAWWRVHSRDGSQKAVHMRLHIYDSLCSAQLSNAILAGFAFSCTTIHLSCHGQGRNGTCAQFSAATRMDHTQLSHYFRLFELETHTHTHTQTQHFLRLQQHNAGPTGVPGWWAVVCGYSLPLWKRVPVSVNKAQFTMHSLKMPGSYPSLFSVQWHQ